LEANKQGEDNFVMEDAEKVPCADFRPGHPVDQRCGYDNATCPFDGDEAICGEKD
jgi:hypothetical protein